MAVKTKSLMNYSAEDEKLIQEKWEELLRSCTNICRNEEDWNSIKRAFFLAKEAHAGIRRRSGEPYLLHPIAVAQIAVDEIGLGVKSVVASLLHDVGRKKKKKKYIYIYIYPIFLCREPTENQTGLRNGK